MSGPLEGVRLVELTSNILAPYACQVLGDFGAEIIKIESFEGDPNRASGGGGRVDLAGVAINLHRNKQSIAIDLKDPRGREIVRRLLGDADVFVTNFRLSALERLGLDYASVRELNEGIIYAEAHGFHTSTGLDEEPSYDDTIQALAGLPRLNEAIGVGVIFPPTLIADKVAGLTIVQGVLAALYQRALSGQGQRVEVPMFNSVLAFTLAEHLAKAAFPGGEAGYSRILTANRGPHQTLDGWLALMPYLDRQWEALFTEAGCEELLLQPWHADMKTRLRDADVVYGELKTVIAKRSTEDWLEICHRLDVPVAEVPTLDEIVNDPARHHGVVVEAVHPVLGEYRQIAPPITFYSTPSAEVAQPAPLIGQDSTAVLERYGYDEAAIDELYRDHVIATSE